MDSNNRAIRNQIAVMCRDRAIDFITAFHLPKDEEAYIIAHEVDGKSLVQISMEHHTTIEFIKNRRRRGFARINDAIEYAKEKGRD